MFLLTSALSFSGASRIMLEADVSPDRNTEWRRMGRAPADGKLELHIALSHPSAGRAALEAVLAEVSDPRTNKYGQYLSNERVHALVRIQEQLDRLHVPVRRRVMQGIHHLLLLGNCRRRRAWLLALPDRFLCGKGV